jgi:hypothetical protein
MKYNIIMDYGLGPVFASVISFLPLFSSGNKIKFLWLAGMNKSKRKGKVKALVDHMVRFTT